MKVQSLYLLILLGNSFFSNIAIKCSATALIHVYNFWRLHYHDYVAEVSWIHRTGLSHIRRLSHEPPRLLSVTVCQYGSMTHQARSSLRLLDE